jgi:TolB-like protein/AraC-like DNA-binding protein
MTLNHSTDIVFIKKLTKIVEANLADETFGVKELAEKVRMSRSQIHRRLKSINNKSVSQFIREIRLNKAKEMLQNDLGTAAEIAYKVGFNSPTYFNTCFHEYFGYPPGEYKKHIPEVLEKESEIKFESSGKHVNIPLPGQALKSNWKRKGILWLTGILLIIATISVYHFINKSIRREKSIVVLPFKNYTNDPTNQVIASGLMEDILNSLFWISDLRVPSRTSSEHFEDSKLSMKEIAKELDVNYILEGSIRRIGFTLLISVQLIDARTDDHIWSDRFEVELTDRLEIPGKIALHVAKELNATISDDELEQVKKILTKSIEAYDAFNTARFLLNRANSIQRADVDRDGLLNSIPFFEKAIKADSNFVQAYTELAHVYVLLSGWGFMPEKKGFLKADSLTNLALRIDENFGQAHALKGAVYFWGGTRNFEGALKEFEKAKQLDPNFPPLYQWYSQLLMITGPIQAAREHINIGLELEPYYWINHNLSAYIHYFEGKNEGAIEDCEMARKLNKDYILNNWLFFLNYLKLGEDLKAVEEIKSILESNPQTITYSNEVLDVYNKSGTEGLIRWIINIRTENPRFVNGLGLPYFVAWLNAILGDKEQCLYWLNKKPFAYMSHLIVSNPDFDFLRSDPRFLKIIEDHKLTTYHTRQAKQ